MPHDVDLILTLTRGLTAALAFGYVTHRLRLSPIVGYLLAGIAVGPFTPGFVAHAALAEQLAEIGVVLLMFGVGLHFEVRALVAARSVVLPGAFLQIAAATSLGIVVGRVAGWSWLGAAVFGLAISVASTVVLTRVLADANALETPDGHLAIGWLVVEDVFTVLVLVLLPAVAGETRTGLWTIAAALGVACAKLAAAVALMLLVGRRAIPAVLAFVAKTGSRELFTLTILVAALGIAVESSRIFGISAALGAFLAGIVVGQSEFSSRAATEALPMRDAFAVLFFVSVGMRFDPSALATNWPLVAGTLAVVLVGKPVAAIGAALAFRQSTAAATTVGLALGQVGEFSFILAALARALGVVSPQAEQVLVAASIASIAANPLLFAQRGRLARALDALKRTPPRTRGQPENREG